MSSLIQIIPLRFVSFLLLALLGASSYAFAQGQPKATEYLTNNSEFQAFVNGESMAFKEVLPLTPLQFNVNQPGEIKLLFTKTFLTNDPTTKEGETRFSILIDGSILENYAINQAAKTIPYQGLDNKSGFLGKRKTIVIETAGKKIGVVVFPNAPLGGGVHVEFTPKEEEAAPALVPLVPVTKQPATKAEVAALPEQGQKAAEGESAKAEEMDASAAEGGEKAAKRQETSENEAEEEALQPMPVPVEEQEAPEVDTGAIFPQKKDKKEIDPIFLMIEPRFGLNLAVQRFALEKNANRADDIIVDPAFAAGLGLYYVLPVHDGKLRLGVGFSRHRYSYTNEIPSQGEKYKLTLQSIPIMLEFDYFILSNKWLVQPFIGVGVGANYVTLDYESQTPNPVKGALVNTKIPEWTYAVSLSAGVHFDVWMGGPFLKVGYLFSKRDYENPVIAGRTLVDNAEHGGIRFFVGYQFTLPEALLKPTPKQALPEGTSGKTKESDNTESELPKPGAQIDEKKKPEEGDAGEQSKKENDAPKKEKPPKIEHPPIQELPSPGQPADALPTPGQKAE